MFGTTSSLRTRNEKERGEEMTFSLARFFAPVISDDEFDKSSIGNERPLDTPNARKHNQGESKGRGRDESRLLLLRKEELCGDKNT
jgi:hypothetical protein